MPMNENSAKWINKVKIDVAVYGFVEGKKPKATFSIEQEVGIVFENKILGERTAIFHLAQEAVKETMFRLVCPHYVKCDVITKQECKGCPIENAFVILPEEQLLEKFNHIIYDK